MDKTLLLTVQYVCNSAGLAVPWNEIAILMGEGITGGAVIQHLAKLRTRMVTQGLPVPPPLRRGGGGSRISTSTSSGSKKKTAATKNEQTTTPAKSKKAGKKAATGSDESEDDDIFNDNDSDATYGEPRPKRVKSDAKGPMRRNIKIEESDEEVDTPSKPPKRKYQKSSSSRNLSAYGTTDINGVPIGDYSDDEAATDTGLVAGGAPWLALEDDYVNYPNTGMKTPYEKKSLVVTFPTAEMADVLGSVEEEENEDVDDDDSEDEAIGGEIESYGGEAHVLSNEETNQNFSLYNQNFENFPAAQMEPAFGATNQNNMYNDLYHAGSKVAPFDGGYEGSIGADFNFGLASTGFNYQNDDFNAGTGLFRNEDMFVGTVPQNNFGYQSAFDNHIGGLPFSNLQDHPDTIPYQVQTSGDYTSSNDQTPAGTSAGAEIPTGYFSNQFHLPSSNGSDGLFHDENFNGNFGNGSFSSNPYGN